MRLRHKACVTLVCFTCAQPGVAAEWTPTWAIEGDPTLSMLASKSELDACIGRTNRYMPKLPDHRLSIGVYIDSTGRPVNVAVLNSSGLQDLDNATIDCIRRAHFKPEARRGETDYKVLSLAWKARSLPTACDPTMTPAATVTIKLLQKRAPDYDELPDMAESMVCACLKASEKIPSAPPVILSSSGNVRLDQGAESVMNRFSAKRWSDGIPGCAAYKVRFVK